MTKTAMSVPMEEIAMGAANSIVGWEEAAGGETRGQNSKKPVYKPCRIVVLTALLLILAFAMFLVQKLVYVIEYVSSNKELLDVLASKLSCQGFFSNKTLF
jgi:hypothetical protein